MPKHVAPRPAPQRPLALSEVYRLLEPGPVVLLTTAERGRSNVMTMSWHTMLEFEPPRVGCVVSERNHSFRALKTTRECVINVPGVELVRQVVACGNCSGRREDKLAKFGLTPVEASLVRAPRIAECFASLECRVADARLVRTYDLFVLEVVKAWAVRSWLRARTVHHRGRGVFAVDGELLRLRSKAK